MVIGIIGTLVVTLLIVWQVFESKKSRLLQIARELYEDRTVRYEGLVRYDGTLPGFDPGSDVYVTILDGAVCLTSKQRVCYALAAEQIRLVELKRSGAETSFHLQLVDEAGERAVVLRAKPARAKMIERYLKVEEKQRAEDQTVFAVRTPDGVCAPGGVGACAREHDGSVSLGGGDGSGRL